MFEKIKNRLKIRNEGYSLVELVIVIAIMAILAGLAMVTVSSISTAKATSAKETFNEDLSSLLTYTKSQNGGTNSDGTAKAENGEYAMLVLKTDENQYKIKFGYSENGTSFSEDSSIDEEILDRAVIYYNADTTSTDMGSELSTVSSSVTVTDADGVTTTETGWIIKYNKSDGSVNMGAGVYTFCKRNSTNSVGKVTLNAASGSHYTGS